ncbi:MAG: hypothetical protein QOG53_1698 [Frankiales bacterium]|jgi:hypothetical protein|nr:hypothetical protein [Frankiales bacterium]
MIRTLAGVLAAVALTLSGLSVTSTPAQADGPVEDLVNQVLAQVPGAPHCC